MHKHKKWKKIIVCFFFFLVHSSKENIKTKLRRRKKKDKQLKHKRKQNRLAKRQRKKSKWENEMKERKETAHHRQRKNRKKSSSQRVPQQVYDIIIKWLYRNLHKNFYWLYSWGGDKKVTRFDVWAQSREKGQHKRHFSRNQARNAFFFWFESVRIG